MQSGSFSELGLLNAKAFLFKDGFLQRVVVLTDYRVSDRDRDKMSVVYLLAWFLLLLTFIVSTSSGVCLFLFSCLITSRLLDNLALVCVV